MVFLKPTDQKPERNFQVKCSLMRAKILQEVAELTLF